MKKSTLKKIREGAKKDFSYQVNETGEYRDTWKIFRIMAEFVEGYQFLSQLKHEVTILGSARLTPQSKYYREARRLGQLLAKAKFSTITGGGPGIMEAGNRGAHEEGGVSVGLNIQLPFEQRVNPYVNKSTAFYYFFTRKVMLLSPAHAFVFFPGGYGTMDEFFEVVDLMEQGKLCKVPIICVGKTYWDPLIDFLREKSMKLGTVNSTQLDLCQVVETADEAMRIIKKTKAMTLHCELSPVIFKGPSGVDWSVFQIMAELVEGFEFLTGQVDAVTMLGSRGIKHNEYYYADAYESAYALSKQGYSIVTGGGIGIAEAANKGAHDAGGQSIGISMKVHGKGKLNDFVNKSITMRFPFVRKLIVTAPSKGFVFFPGGFGTLHNFFEVLTLIQTEKMERIPIILYDSAFWKPLDRYIKNIFVDTFKTISPGDEDIYMIVDDIKDITKIIKKSRKRKR